MNVLLLLFISYLIGSIPFSHIFPKLKGKEVSQAGTKNIGATNALVVSGPLVGALALAGDIAKGYLAVSLAGYFFSSHWIEVAAAVAAIIGHDFSIFLKFKGGKGIATTGGALLAFDFVLAIIILLLWLFLIIISRYFIPSTLIMLGILPVIMWVLGQRLEYIVFALLAFCLALYSHREDIKRIISGKELRTAAAVKQFLGK